MTNSGKELVGTHWAHRISGERWTVKDQFRLGEDLESWVDLRDLNGICQMVRTDQLVRDYSKIVLEFQYTN